MKNQMKQIPPKNVCLKWNLEKILTDFETPEGWHLALRKVAQGFVLGETYPTKDPTTAAGPGSLPPSASSA